MKMQAIFAVCLIGVANAARLVDTNRYDLVDGSSVVNNAPGKLGMFGGKNSTINKHPYLVSLVQNGNAYCAGTILNANWVITNADCIKNRKATDITIVSSSNDGVTGTVNTVKQLVPHPNYGKVHLDSDYGCIQIDGAFKWSKTVKAAKLPTAPIDDYTWLNVAGYGSVSAAGTPSRQLQMGQLQWLNKSVCKSMLSSLQWTDTFACAYNAGKTTLCKYDFGEGLVKNNVIYAIYTAGMTANFCTVNSMPSIFADVLTVVQWISDTISQS